VLDRMAARLRARPEILDRRRETVEHPFGSIKQWMNQGAFLDASLIDELLDGLPREAMLVGDHAYGADKIRSNQAERGVWANTPPKRNHGNAIVFSPCLSRQRNLIERFSCKINHYRGIATR